MLSLRPQDPSAAAGLPLGPGVRVGRYELMHPLGMGGMAEVFKARATGPRGYERTVVVKRILPIHSRDAEFVRMFTDEAKIMGMLHHPNVVQVYDFGAAEDGSLFLAMEFVDGPPVSRILRTLRAAGRRVPVVIAAYIAREICRALHYLHHVARADGTPLCAVHRDVTPSNIVLTASGGVKLLDFGVAKHAAAQQATRDGTVKGKPAYLAPEQLEGKPIDGRVDVFALGVVLHEMLSLEHLFAGDSDMATVRKILALEIPAPSALREDVPPELDRIVMGALERDPARRTASAAQMSSALDDFLVGQGLHLDEVVAFIHDIENENSALVARRAAGAAAARAAAVERSRLQVGLSLETMTTKKDLVPLVFVDRVSGVLHSRRVRVGALVAATLVSMGAVAWSLVRSGDSAPETPRIDPQAMTATVAPAAQ